ncbi:hydroxyethylthiazole kinase [Aquibacillus albus]|uniref:Hydroxyethylthiazole kinase n=1 Tax=Aquibacillus albus TaxID=1168171 RepID=A0ABS2MZ85_9BACI|nr:hydroxyethylthiazole kinase [Aquibacillus albus]MBM7571156.1 hydroxyethylthiazole kinase [Aquibacillus albus]
MSDITALIDSVRTKQPLVHNITNQVVINFTANGLYALGAAPVMANAVEEAKEMAQNADALLLNIGTLTTAQVEAMVLAGKSANEKGIPVVLDPVGVGATSFRTEAAKKILENVKISVVRGNAGEISSLAGLESNMKGVDGTSDEDFKEIALAAVKQLQVPVIVTGKQDVITDGNQMFVLDNGHPLLTKVTGTGCLLSSVIAAFLSTSDSIVKAAAGAVSFYNIAAEIAAEHTSAPGSFQVAFLDALYQLKSNVVSETAKIEHLDITKKEE